MERGGARRRSDIIKAAFIDFMQLCNEKMLFPTLQMICGIASVVFCILSVLLLAYEKPLAYLKDNFVCLCGVLFCIFPILFGYIKFCRFLEFRLQTRDLVVCRVFCLVIETSLAIGLGVGGIYALEELKGFRSLWGVMSLLISLCCMEIFLMVEKDIMLVDSAFNVLLGISFIKFKTKWHIIFLVVIYCTRAGAFFLLKEKDRKIKQAERERERADMDQQLGCIEDLYEEAKGGSPNLRLEKINLQSFQRLGTSITDFRETYFQQRDGPTDGVE